MPADSGPTIFPENAGRVLLPMARAAIAARLGVEQPVDNGLAWLKERGATFVTVRRDDKLRGCIGTLRAHRPLDEDVKANAVAAAFRDPRFAPLDASELAAIALEISLLSPLEPVSFADEPDALKQLRAGVDGVVFEYGHHASTFLPQVWEDLKEPAEFLAHLKYKAGLPPDFWDRDVKLSRYTVHKWREEQG